MNGDQVIAACDFDPEELDAESMAMSDFLWVLRQWRQRVLEARETIDEPLPETYRRNPARGMDPGA